MIKLVRLKVVNNYYKYLKEKGDDGYILFLLYKNFSNKKEGITLFLTMILIT
jgi:hypothetical protein